MFYVLQQTGAIWRLEEKDGALEKQLFVDLRDYYNVVFTPEGPGSCHECGLYSMAFHPQFAENGYIYLSYTVDGVDGMPLQSYIARFRTADGGVSLVKDGGTLEQEVIYHVEQPTNIHNNGQINFGTDGYLYVSFGDGGVGHYSQEPTKPFGSILRLTDTGEAAPGNEIEGGLPEVYAMGFRNPWFWSFDRETGDLWAGDVGQGLIEEVDRVVSGGNYGWPCYEGKQKTGSCADDVVLENYIEPVWDYGRVDGRSVTGGFVYRGSAIPELYGAYIYGDFGSGLIWALRENQTGGYQRDQLAVTGKMISAFAEDNNGELYTMDYLGGELYRITAPEQSQLPPLPELLSATGCMDAENVTQPADHLLPYNINEPFWSDGADKERFLRMPEGTSAQVDAVGNILLPVGSVVVKNFRLQNRLIETRLLLHQPDSGWNGYSYVWNEDESEATLLEGAFDTEVAGQVWHFPSRAECAQCHTGAAGSSLGLEVAQLNQPNANPNPLDEWLEHGLVGYVNNRLKSQVLPPSSDTSVDVDARARSYLHSNCSYCHRPGGTSQATMDLRFTTHLVNANVCNAEPMQGDLGIVDGRLIVPGDAERSVLWQRISSEGDKRMPPLASNKLDDVSVALIREWIDGMENCDGVAGPADAVFRIRSGDHYLAMADGLPVLLAEDDAADVQWQVLPEVESFYRLRLGDSGKIQLHFEADALEVSFAEDYWWSTHWELAPTAEGFRIRSRVRGDEYLEIRDGEVKLVPEADAGQTLWQFEPAPVVAPE